MPGLENPFREEIVPNIQPEPGTAGAGLGVKKYGRAAVSSFRREGQILLHHKLDILTRDDFENALNKLG